MTRTVLIVEDAEPCRDTLEVALMKVPGVLVHSVATAEEALTRLAFGRVCALVTALHLPRMDGFELIQAIRSEPHSVSLPILDRKSTRLNSSHLAISYAVFCLKK